MSWTTVKTAIRAGIVALGVVIITAMGIVSGWIMNQSLLPILGGGIPTYVASVVFLWVFVAVTTLPWLPVRRPGALPRGRHLGSDGEAAEPSDGSDAATPGEGEGRESE